MKHYYPSYYEKFRCIAASCPDSCCQGWDVVIDCETEGFYNSVKGDFGERLRKAIYTDSDGDRVFHLADEKKCPFWGNDKLCEIYKELGEEHLCDTCAHFPRLTLEFEDFCEHSLALACPEAARLILTTDDAYKAFTHMHGSGCEDYTSQEINLMLNSRSEFLKLLGSEKPLCERLFDCIDYGKEVQKQLDGEKYTPEAIFRPEALAQLFSELEYIEEVNRKMIVSACRKADFSGQEAELGRLALYYLYRYYLSAVITRDVSAVIAHMVVSLVVISNLARENGLSITDAAQKYSKETEQSYENMELLTDAFAFDLNFCADNLKKLIG